MDELILVERFQRLLARWWLLVIAALAGALIGYLFNMLRPPVYEATARFYVSIDSSKTAHLLDQPLMYQYDEDMALAATEHILRDALVREIVSEAALKEGIQVAPADLLVDGHIERKHAFWELSYRNPDPGVAQKVVNLWAETGYKSMLAWKENGMLVDYIVFNEFTPADLPEEPVLFDRNSLMLAGAVLGLIAGVVLANAGIGFGPASRAKM